MRNGLFLCLVFSTCLFLCSGCNKDNDQEVLFEKLVSVNFELPGGLTPFQVHYFEISGIPNTIKQELDRQGLTESGYSSIEARAGFMQAEFTNVDYDFMRDLSVRVFANDPDQWKEAFYLEEDHLWDADNATSLIPTAVNLQDPLSEDQFGLVIRVELRDFTPVTMGNTLELSFGVIR